MKHEIFIIVNPTAGNGLAEKRWEKFENDLKKNQIYYHAVKTEYQNHATDLVDLAISEGYRRIGVFSGDGTLNEVIQGFFEKDLIKSENLMLIFLPAGSSCDFEKKFKNKQNLMERIQSKNIISIDIFKVECQDTSGKQINRYTVNNSSIGIISLANEKFNSVKGITKKIKQINVNAGAIICGLQAIIKFTPFTATMTLNDKKIPLKYLSNITVFKTAYFGGDMNYGVETIQDDGKMSVVWLDGSSRLRLASLIPSLFSGNILKKKEAHFRTCSKLEIHTEDAAIVESDGENIGFAPVKYTVLPKSLKVVI